MSAVEELKAKLQLPPVTQIGFVVWDVDKAVEHYLSMLGMGPWTVYEFVPDQHWFWGKPSHLKLKMAKAMSGNIEFELIQPLEGESLHLEFLETSGEGVQHLGFNVPDYDDTFDRFVKAGFEPAMRAETYVDTYKGRLKACYFDTRRVTGIALEIMWRSWSQES